MEVIPRGPASPSHGADRLALRDRLAGMDTEIFQMSVEGLHPIPMIDDDEVAVSTRAADAADDESIIDSQDGCATVGADVDGGVTGLESLRYRPTDRPDQGPAAGWSIRRQVASIAGLSWLLDRTRASWDQQSVADL